MEYCCDEELNNNVEIGKKEIVLTENQEECVQKLCNIMVKHGLALNTSCMGEGKSIMTIECIRRLNIKNCIMICPYNMIPQWEKYNEFYGVGFSCILSYDTLRGTLNKSNKNKTIKLKHGLLERTENNFYPTQKLIDLINEGLWIFFDECQKLKNDRIQRRAAMAMCKTLYETRNSRNYDGFSGIYYFSATPFDKKIHCVNLCYTTGIISRELFSERGLENSGLMELKIYCEKINPEETRRIWGSSELGLKKSEDVAYNLCIKVLFPAITAFTKVNQQEQNQTIWYTREKITDEVGMKILEASEIMIHQPRGKLTEITDEMEEKYAEILQLYPGERSEILSLRSGITHGNITAQVIKTHYIIAPLAKKALDEIPNCKVTIFLDYKEAIRVVEKYLHEYGVVILTGTSSLRAEEKTKKIALFQKPDLEYRVLISICQVGSLGLDFDDKHGNFPRIGFMNLIHSVENLIQSAGRTSRKNTKSPSLFFVCKAYDGNLEEDEVVEKSLENSVTSKSKVIEETLKANGIIPPLKSAKTHDMFERSFAEYLESAGSYRYEEETRKEPEIKVYVERSDIFLDL